MNNKSIELKITSCPKSQFDFNKWKSQTISDLSQKYSDPVKEFERFRKLGSMLWWPENQDKDKIFYMLIM